MVLDGIRAQYINGSQVKIGSIIKARKKETNELNEPTKLNESRFQDSFFSFPK